MTPVRIAKPSVLRSFPLDRDTIVEASAGTGKTHALEHWVVELLLRTDAHLEQILVVTFTEKATHELRARVRAKLESLRMGKGPLASEEDVRCGDYWTIDAAAQAKLARSVRAFDAATITTIHAFCQRVLRENAFASGRLFREQQVDGREVFARALRDAMRRDVAVHPGRAPWLEVALRVGWSMQRIEELVWRCATLRGELRPVFDPARLERAVAAMPVIDQLDRGLVEAIKASGVRANTARAIGDRLFALSGMAEEARATRDFPWFVVQAQALDFSCLLDNRRHVSPAEPLAAHAFHAGLELARATPSVAAALAGALLPPTTETLARSKREAGQYDFDDMLLLLDQALQGPHGRALAEAMQARWRYALVDEFQDTDETQWSIFRRAFHEARRTRTAPGSLFLVGDPKQSIYRFRGADVHTYLRARDEVRRAGGGHVTLDRSFRATPWLIDAINALFDARAPEPLFDAEVAYAPVSCGNPDRQLLDGSGRRVSALHVLRCRNLAVEALGPAIARQILEATSAARPWRLDGRPLELRDIFVLTRTEREGRILGSALRAAGIPFAFYKEDGLFQTAEAQDVLAVLTAIAAPENRSARLSAWLTPFFGLPLSGVEEVRDLDAGHPLLERLQHWAGLAEKCDFERLFESVMRDSGVVRREIFFATSERALTNYLHIFEALLDHARRVQTTLTDLVDELRGLVSATRLPVKLEGNVQRLESERQSVQIMTIHKSKGLEAALVFVACNSSSRSDEVRVYHDGDRRMVWVGKESPEVKALIKGEENGEDQRLIYVAMTRAQGRVVAPCAVGERGEPGKATGFYGHMNRRLASIVAEGHAWATVEDVAPPDGDSPRDDMTQATTWAPPEALLRKEDRGGTFAGMRSRHAGALITSYTRMRSERGRPRGAWSDPAQLLSEDTFAAHESHGRIGGSQSARSIGVFLHELLERVSLASFRLSDTFEGWRTRPEVRERFDEAMAAYRIDPSERESSERIVWSAYTTAVQLPAGHRIAGLAWAPRAAREMSFVYPMPGHEDGPGRVLVRGSLDLAFEHEGLTYFVDWKSDSLSSYELPSMARRVEEHYVDQLQLYSLAIAKLLGIRSALEHEARFGGLLYCFLRGFGPHGAGLWSVRPTWNDLLSWQDRLRAWRPEGRS